MDEKKRIPSVTIVKGSLKVTMDRKDLVEAKPSHDGMVFNFMEGFHMVYTDSYMPAATKDLIRTSVDNFPKASLTIEVNNYAKPVVADMT